MDLSTGYPFYLIKHGLPFSYPKLEESVKTEVVIVGGGISGALAAYYLVNAGVECILVDERTIGLGSTCASTSLLQYELDKPLSELAELVGYETASRAYQLCSESIDTLEAICRKINFKDFERNESLFFAATIKDKGLIEREFAIRKRAGFKVELLDEKQMVKQFGFSAPNAILSEQGAATNAYMLTHALLKAAEKKGLKVYDRTAVKDIVYKNSGVELITSKGFKIKAGKMVNATGYQVTNFIDKDIVKLNSTYAFASENFETIEPVLANRTMFWNTADPYLYIRRTKDNRIIMGGRDEEFYNPEKRDKLIKKKTKQLVNDFKKLFPDMDMIAEFSWTGTFGSTKDSLPYIGKYDKTPNAYYSLGFGGNGITFSVIAAEIIRDLIIGKKNKDAELFSFQR